MEKIHAEPTQPMLKRRTRQFALSVIRLVQTLNRGLVSDVLSRQLVRSGTSVGANYRSACRARSRADMASKLAISEEECDETLYWLDLLVESGEITSSTAQALADEGEEILKLLVASLRTLRLSSAASATVRESTARYRTKLDLIRDESLSEIPNSKFQIPN